MEVSTQMKSQVPASPSGNVYQKPNHEKVAKEYKGTELRLKEPEIA